MASILKVDTIQTAGGTAALTTDTSGRVFRSNIPHFIAGFATANGLDYSSWTKLPFTKTAHAGMSASSDFDDSNNRYIAPVAGLYWFSWNVRFDAIAAANYIQTEMRVNGTGIPKYRGLNGPPPDTYISIGSHGIIQLNATDYVEAWVTINGDSSINRSDDSNFHGYLIG